MKTFQRQGGKTAGRADHYWFTPTKQFKLRSIYEIERCLLALDAFDGDEDEAKKYMNCFGRPVHKRVYKKKKEKSAEDEKAIEETITNNGKQNAAVASASQIDSLRGTEIEKQSGRGTQGVAETSAAELCAQTPVALETKIRDDTPTGR